MEINPEYSLEGPMLKLKLQYFGHLMWRSDWKDPDAGKDWRQEEKGTTEDERVGWHHWLNGHEFEQALRVGDGQEIAAVHGVTKSRTCERLNWTELTLCSRQMLVPCPEIQPMPLQWKHGASTAGLPGKSWKPLTFCLLPRPLSLGRTSLVFPAKDTHKTYTVRRALYSLWDLTPWSASIPIRVWGSTQRWAKDDCLPLHQWEEILRIVLAPERKQLHCHWTLLIHQVEENWAY